MSDAGHKQTDKILYETQKRVHREYARANKEIQKKLDDYMAQFEDGANQLRQMVERGEATQRQYEEYLERKLLTGKRWKAMRDTLAEDYHNANKIAMSTVMEHMPDVYALNHDYAAYQLEHDYHINTSYTLYNRDAAERLMRSPAQLLPPPREGSKSALAAANKDLRWNARHIQSELLQGILQGESYHGIARRLQRVTGMNEKAAIRNARTMITNAQNSGRIACARRIAATGLFELQKEWVATLDHRTRDSHVDMHGEVVDLDKPFSNGLDRPGHGGSPEEVYNCRCDVVFYPKGFKSDAVKMSPKLGDMSFEEWRAHKRSDFKNGVKNVIMSKERMNRARNIRSIDDLNKVTQSPVIDMDSYEGVQKHFANKYGIAISGFDSCDLFGFKATMAGFDDILSEFPDAAEKIKTIKYVPQLKAMGDIDRSGRVRIGKSGLQDYGTGVHEAVHALDYKRSKPGTNSFSADVVAEARKELGLRKNSREYNSLAFALTNSIRDAGDPAELFAYAVESERGGASNKLSSAIYEQLKGAK